MTPVRAALVAAIAVLVTACTYDADAGLDAPSSESRVVVDVYAAASLSGVFTQLAVAFEAANPELDVTLTFAGSSELATHIGEGAPADVFAAADEETMSRVTADMAGSSTIFATNHLTIAVPRGNGAGVAGAASLGLPGLRVVTCAPSVPCGAAAARVQEAYGVAITAASEESNVTDVLGKVASGEADAGLVYVTDIARAAGVEEVRLGDVSIPPTPYPIAVMATGDAADAGQRFVDFVLSNVGRATLADAGFGLP